METVARIYVLLHKDLMRRKNNLIAASFEIVIPIVLVGVINICLPISALDKNVPSISFESFKPTQCIPRYSTYGKIIYEPSSPFIDTLMSRAACYAGYKKSNVVPGKLNNSNTLFSIGVEFENASADGPPNTLNYTLYVTNRAWDRMSHLWRKNHLAMPRYDVPTLYTITEMQRAIDVSYLYLRNITGEQVRFESLHVQKLTASHFSLMIRICFFMVIALIVPPVVSRAVEEKSTGAKELMLTMGIIRWHLWMAKFLEATLFSSITIGGMVLFLYVPLMPKSNYLVIPPSIFWSVLMYGLVGVILFLFFVICIFDRATVAVYLTEIFLSLSFVFISVTPYFIGMPVFIRYVLCLFPHVAFMEGVNILLKFDDYGKDVKLLENLSGEDGSPCLLLILVFMTINILLYLMLTWYLEHVKPGRFGLPRPYDFCFQKYYWFPRKCLPSRRPREPLNENFELIETNQKPGVSVRSVIKIYRSPREGSFKKALDNVSLDFYQGEIGGVLGHNGAGKTTLFSIITGMTRPSEGEVFINDFWLSGNTCEARRRIGVCPQEDMLFNDLTVLETLKFYGVVKGLNSTEIQREALDLLEKLKLTHVKHTEASKLSGGQKRKLSLAIAVLGGSEVLVLDEPTSGMDTDIRREVWELLLDLRTSRTIVLTTHFLEEADFLCDRISILDHGKVKCHGSPSFLKSKFGKGYILKVVRKDENNPTEEYFVSLVNCHVKDAKLARVNGRAMIFELPEIAEHEFPSLFHRLEEEQRRSQIEFSLSASTLEDAFLRMWGGERETDFSEDDLGQVDQTLEKPNGETEKPCESSVSLLAYQFWALMCKKWIFFRRYYKLFLLFTVPPALITIVRTVIPELGENPQSLHSWQTRLTYSLDLYPSSLVLYSGLKQPDGVKLFGDLVRGSSGRVEEVEDIMITAENIFMDDLYTFLRKVNFGVSFEPQGLHVFQNDYGVHMVPVALNFIHNFLLKSSYKDSAIVTSVDNRFANKETLLYARTQVAEKCRIVEQVDFSGIQSMFYLMSPLNENLLGSKELQLMCTRPSLYWLSHLMFDSLSFFASTLVLYLGLGLSLQDKLMIEDAGEILLALFLWGAGLILLNYVISTMNKNTSGAFTVSVTCYVTFTFIVPNLVCMRILPAFFKYLHPNSILMIDFGDHCAGKRTYFIQALSLYDFTLFSYLIVMDSGIPREIFHFLLNKLINVDYSLEEAVPDGFVATEEEEVKKLILKNEAQKLPLLVSELSRWYFKRFRPSPAVRGLSFSVIEGECFGLLGVNGAGKTSTFRMLVGSLPTSRGRIYSFSEQLSIFGRRKYLNSIGYCPQSGGLIPVFSGREFLILFARLRGLRRRQARREVKRLLEKLDLWEHANKECGTYSGGNKKKLSMAAAVIGGCPLVFLDEPTNGVDPLSRRRIWAVIEEVKKGGSSVILTTHSMDECEALCSRLAIMVNGKFRCIGETTILRNRFGGEYNIQMKLKRSANWEEVYKLEEIMVHYGRLRARHTMVLQFETYRDGPSGSGAFRCQNFGLNYWSGMFSVLERIKRDFPIVESYTVNTTSLEQIFVLLSKEENEKMKETSRDLRRPKEFP